MHKTQLSFQFSNLLTDELNAKIILHEISCLSAVDLKILVKRRRVYSVVTYIYWELNILVEATFKGVCY